MSTEVEQLQPAAAAPAGARGAAFRPVFIVGCERSGTTLLAVMLDRHSELAMTPETHYLLRLRGRGGRSKPAESADRTRRRKMVERYFAEDRAKDLGVEVERVLSRFEKMPCTRGSLLRAILEEYGGAHGKPRVGEKTPFHLWFVDQIFAWFPERVVGIVRDGRDVIRSVLKAPWTAQRRLRPHCLTWVQGVRAAERYARRYPRRFLNIRYEDLLVSPEKTLRAVDAHLGLSYEPFQLAAGSGTDVIPAREVGWKGRALGELDPSRIGAWKTHTTDGERLVMNSMMRGELLRLGYGETDSPRSNILRLAWEYGLNLLCKAGLYRVWFNVVGRYTPSGRAHRRAGETPGAATSES